MQSAAVLGSDTRAAATSPLAYSQLCIGACEILVHREREMNPYCKLTGDTAARLRAPTGARGSGLVRDRERGRETAQFGQNLMTRVSTQHTPMVTGN